MPTINDRELGEIVVRPHKQATRISLRIAPDGRLRVSTPPFTPLPIVKIFLKTSKNEIKKLLQKHRTSQPHIVAGPVGKSHSLVVQSASANRISLSGTKIVVELAPDSDIKDPAIQQDIRQIALKTLRKEAKNYLPRRLRFLADKHDFEYDSLRLTHASSRWGSCSSRNTISLNIALMKLPFEILDYVIIHELCHLRHLNHSSDFWNEVAEIDPDYKKHRQKLKQYTPYI